jgi:cohesin loading factor subunit SCC2
MSKPAVKTLVSRCTNDISVSVRESSLRLISRCIELKPGLEAEMMSSILQRVNDGSISIRKRAMKILKEIYLKNAKTDARSVIAEALLYRVADLDKSVRELACQSIEEIWISPFYQPTLTGNASAQSRLTITSHIALIVKTVQRDYHLPTVFNKAYP